MLSKDVWKSGCNMRWKALRIIGWKIARKDIVSQGKMQSK
jgi:hypothetical protein